MTRTLCSQNCIGRLVEICDGASLAHELGVVTDGKVYSGAKPACVLHRGNHQRFGRARQNCAAEHEHVG